MKPIIFQGSPAFSDFRMEGLLKELNKASPSKISKIDAVSVYFINAPDLHNPTHTEHICSLLNAKPGFDRKGGVFITPRKGTISPWSSKATDIFHNCGLQVIKRVEHGVHLRILDNENKLLDISRLGSAAIKLYDRMTEAVYEDVDDFFQHFEPAPLRTLPLISEGISVLKKANIDWGLALSPQEVDYLFSAYKKMQRDPTDAELVMFSQVNSEHCRHKIFNADWIVDGEKSGRSLFQMIRNTHKLNPDGVLVAYSDNSGVFKGFEGDWWEIDPLKADKNYRKTSAQIDILCKVETHNHPTAISPFPGAATGVGGEIRDEGATGIGGRSKAGLSAFMVSNLAIPGYKLPWEISIAEHPGRMANPLEIMLRAPIGGAAFGNEFGRPQLCGMFRTLQLVHNGQHRGYHKPIMAAGGMGNLKREHVAKKDIPSSACIIQLGGPAMKIGLGGGAASSIAAGTQSEELDFDSVQRGNPEMQRRCQQVIDCCIALGPENPILSIHDIGAGGLSNGLPELVEATGGHFHLRKIHSEDSSMSPMELWCNESQERYVLAVMPERIEEFRALCTRERCPFAFVGKATDDGQLILEDSHFATRPIDMEMGVVLGKTPRLTKDVQRLPVEGNDLNLSEVELTDAIDRVLRFPAVANKSFLITIADRTVTGMVTRDQMVGPWQTPVADVAVTSTTLESYTGEAMAIGERTPLAILDAPASGRIAIGECLTNLAATYVDKIGNIKLSANWMVASGEPGEDANLFDTVKAVGMELCPALGICIPVGKDSMSMRTRWKDSSGEEHKQTSPLSLMVTGFSSVKDVRKTVTPDLKSTESTLILIDLGGEKNRLGGSTLAQVYSQVGNDTPDLDEPVKFLGFFNAIQELLKEDLILSYHDRSDGGLLTTIVEMAIAGRKGATVLLDKLVAKKPESRNLKDAVLAALFAEELGAVIEIEKSRLAEVMAILAKHTISDISHLIGGTTSSKELSIKLDNELLYSESITALNRTWSELTYRMQSLRDNPDCAKQEYESLLDELNTGLRVEPVFSIEEVENFHTSAVYINSTKVRPKIAILREQGVNGHNEMAFAFDRVGFEAVDLHMTDLLNEYIDLSGFSGLVACGGFSYGDVLGAGTGWAKSILYNPRLKEQFTEFFERRETFTLGICNGCQMISQLKDIIPGASHWPEFKRNQSEQFEARLVNVEVLDSPSIFFKGMEGSLLPIPVAHGEGRADFSETGDLAQCVINNQVSMRYTDYNKQATEAYPYNPNGSPYGSTGFTTTDGRATILMPHPERCFRSVQMSYRAPNVFRGEAGPWLKMFQNARLFAAKA